MARLNKDISLITRFQWVFHLVGVAVVFLVLGLAIQRKSDANLAKINIKIDGEKHLITSEDVVKLMQTELGYHAERSSLKRLDLMKLERLLDNDDRVLESDAYVDKHMILHIDIKQRKPIVRIMSSGDSYYLDALGHYVPVSKSGTIRVPVATGIISKYNQDYLKDDKNNLGYVYDVANAISQDEFLSALIEQIDLERKDHMVLIPKMGRNKIILGKPEYLNEKLIKLKKFYRRAVSKTGVDKFTQMDLQYVDRVFTRSDNS